jgi:hypothetical protein
MTKAVFLAVLSLTLLPSLAAAGPGCRGEKLQETAASCMPGMTWDSVSGTCVETPSS